jgi:hypothetical protein
MTDKAISPLRRRMIEDMTIGKLTPDTQRGYIRTIKNLARRGCPALSAASGEERCRYADSQSHRLCAAVLFQGHAQAIRHHRAHGVHS